MRSILLVEDDHNTRVVLRQVLESAGYQVFSAANGIDGLALFKRIGAPDLVLLDQNLPLLSGDELLRSVKQDAALAGVPVVVMSAISDRCAGLGAEEFVAKPFDDERILAVVRRHCA